MVSQSSLSHDKQNNVMSWDELVSNEGMPVSSRTGHYKSRAKNGKLAVLVAFLAVLVLGGTTFRYMTEAYGANIGRATYFQEHSHYEDLMKKLETLETEAEQLMTNCAVSVTDTDLCLQLAATLDEAGRIDVSGCQVIDPYEVSASVVAQQSECLSSKNALMERVYKELKGKIKPVHEAVALKSVGDYEEILISADKLIEEAHTLIDETENAVSSTLLWKRASDAVDELEKKLEEIRAVDEDSVRDYTAVTQEVRQLVEALRSSMDTLRQDHERWIRDQELAQARQQTIQQNGQNQSSQQNTQNVPGQNVSSQTQNSNSGFEGDSGSHSGDGFDTGMTGIE